MAFIYHYELNESEVLASTSLTPGSIIYCKDSTNIYMVPTTGGKAVKMAETTKFLTEKERSDILTPINGKKYFCYDTGKMWIYYNDWICINPDNEVVQSDWNQNDSTSPSYIKNRICYEEQNLIDITGAEYSVPVRSTTDDAHIDAPLELGQVWNVWHDSDGSGNIALGYENLEVQEDADGNLYLGDLNMSAIPFYVKGGKIYFNKSFIHAIQPSTVKLVCVSGYVTGEPIVHQIDPKFIKDMYYENTTFTPLTIDGDNIGPYNWEIDKKYVLRVDGIIYEFDGFTQGDYASYMQDYFYYIGAPAASPTETNWENYPFSIYTFKQYFPREYLTVYFSDLTTNHTVEILERHFKQIDEKYIPIATCDDTIDTLIENDMLAAVTDSDGSILSTNGNIILW